MTFPKTTKEINHRLQQTSNVTDVYSTLKNIELNIVESCNRTCEFCPHDMDDYQFTKGKADLSLYEKLVEQLNSQNYSGSITLCGFGEPLMHKNINTIINILRKSNATIELITNGELLTKKKLDNLFLNGLDFINVSIYESKYVKKITDLLSQLREEQYLIRDRYLGKIKIVDRKNIITSSVKTNKSRSCWLPSYKMIINYNGDVMLCCNDWTRTNVFGNIYNTDIWDIWCENLMSKRLELLAGHRNGVCASCNIEGTDYGNESAKFFAG
jgi:MoaA/NifB/PqqE/SkfB family radical SAM enzyme